jgi:hypothetical protein
MRTFSGAASAAALVYLSGCSVYLHDDALQKKTGTILSTYKAADISGAMKASLDAQAQFDKFFNDSAVVSQKSLRESELVQLLARSDGGFDALRKRIADRLRAIANPDAADKATLAAIDNTGVPKAGKWLFWHEKLVAYRNNVAAATRDVAEVRALYIKAGGTGFSDCEKFVPPAGLGQAAAPYAQNLQAVCGLLKIDQATLQGHLALADALGPGKFKDAKNQAADASAAVAKLDSDAAAATKLLEKAKKDAEAKNTPLDDQVIAALTTLDQDIAYVDQVFALADQSRYSPGALLAKVEFSKTNLCDVLAAADGKNCQGGAATTDGGNFEKQVVAVIAGLGKIADPPPSAGTLAIALAYQTQLQSVATIRVNAVKKKLALLEDEEDALLREYELLTEAGGAIANLPAACNAGRQTVDALLRDRSCGAPVAKALAAYNASWVRGRTVAQLDSNALGQLDTLTALQVAQANAVARDAILTVTLTELDAFGQGGVEPKTIAAFITAFSTIAIAKGVN